MTEQLGMQWLIFVIDAGEIKWRSAHGSREEAVELLNHMRPDGQQDDHPDDETEFTSDDCIEFAFIVPSPHFVSFI